MCFGLLSRSYQYRLRFPRCPINTFKFNTKHTFIMLIFALDLCNSAPPPSLSHSLNPSKAIKRKSSSSLCVSTLTLCVYLFQCVFIQFNRNSATTQSSTYVNAVPSTISITDFVYSLTYIKCSDRTQTPTHTHSQPTKKKTLSSTPFLLHPSRADRPSSVFSTSPHTSIH